MSKRLFQYPGSKSKLLGKISPYFPRIVSLCEPFCGSAVVSLEITASSYYLNDRCKNIYNFFKVVRNDESREKLIHMLEFTPCDEETWRSCDGKGDDVTRAWCFLVSYIYSFRALGRGFNRLNLAHGSNRIQSVNLFKKVDFLKSRYFRNWLSRVSVTNMDALDFIGSINKRKTDGVFIYCDPPYVDAVQMYEGDEYKEEDFKKLLDMLADTPHRFMLSCYSSDLVQDYASKYGWAQKSFSMKTIDMHARKQEFIFYNYKIGGLL